MPCFSPLDAWKLDGGEISFKENARGRMLQLPCGQCVGCRLERSRQWAVRCMHEAQMHDENSFVTLTYSDEHAKPSLDYRDFQLFMKRLRKQCGKARFYMCGEYGEQFSRPHFHACLFGIGFADRSIWRRLPSGSNLYRSDTLESLWPFGFSSIGDVTFESAAYVARYVMKKVTGPQSEEHYQKVDPYTGEIFPVTPEFTRMSLKPGIGAEWLKRYWTDVYRGDASGEVIMNGVSMKPPRYYDNFLARHNGEEYDAVAFQRFEKSLARREDNTPERLLVRETVAKARLSFKKRSL